MNVRIPCALALALSAAVGASTASAASLSTGKLALDVQSAVGADGNVNVSLDGGVATLTGNVDNLRVANAARSAALSHESVREVVDLTFES